MRVLMFGSRALTWKHLHVFEDLAWHSVLVDPCPLPEFIRWIHLSPAPAEGGPRYDEVQAAARRDIEMAEARPDRAYCVHTDLDASKGSIITARALTERGIRFWCVRVTMAGEIVSMEER
jgi:hypothetical protein